MKKRKINHSNNGLKISRIMKAKYREIHRLMHHLCFRQFQREMKNQLFTNSFTIMSNYKNGK